jgi:hypothetical protein
MSDQDWPPAARGTREEFEAPWQRALAQGPAVPITAISQRCLLLPSQPHCFHEQLRLWDDLFPPAMVCCWCGELTANMNETPLRHGPHVPE